MVLHGLPPARPPHSHPGPTCVLFPATRGTVEGPEGGQSTAGTPHLTPGESCGPYKGTRARGWPCHSSVPVSSHAPRCSLLSSPAAALRRSWKADPAPASRPLLLLVPHSSRLYPQSRVRTPAAFQVRFRDLLMGRQPSHDCSQPPPRLYLLCHSPPYLHVTHDVTQFLDCLRTGRSGSSVSSLALNPHTQNSPWDIAGAQ